MDKGPVVYEVQTRCWLNELSNGAAGYTLDDVPDSALMAIKQTGATWLWLMGVWQTGAMGMAEARNHPALQDSYRAALPDFTTDDVIGSPYAIQDYHVHSDFGGDQALANIRKRLAEKGIKLMLDFVPNHVSVDNQWAFSHPEFFIVGDEQAAAEGRGRLLPTRNGSQVLLHGRDPYFPPWTDTLQLNWAEPALLLELKNLLLHLAAKCDGLRCDMAMLLLKAVFNQTWGLTISTEHEPWRDLIEAVKDKYPSFIFAAEAYWDLEWALTCQGFDFVYDKRLYDRLCQNNALSINQHLQMNMDFHQHQLRFLENHDEPRAAGRLSWPKERAATAILSGLPGGWLLHHHQADGAKIKLPVQLCRYAAENTDPKIRSFFELVLKEREDILDKLSWRQLWAGPAWANNGSYGDFVAYCWHEDGRPKKLVIVNFSDHDSQCRFDLSAFILPEKMNLVDTISGEVYCREGSDLLTSGLYVALPPWGIHYFNIV